MLAAACVLLLSTTLISCGRDDRLLRDAAIDKAIAEAEATRPRAALPPACDDRVPHAEVSVGITLERLLKLEQQQLNVANNVIVDCAEFYLAQ